MTDTIATLTVEILIPNSVGLHREPISLVVFKAIQLGMDELDRDWRVRAISLGENDIGDDEI